MELDGEAASVIQPHVVRKEGRRRIYREVSSSFKKLLTLLLRPRRKLIAQARPCAHGKGGVEEQLALEHTSVSQC